jgi:hypothetical protein
MFNFIDIYIFIPVSDCVGRVSSEGAHVLTRHCLQHIVYLSYLYFIICIFRSAMKRVAADLDALDNKKARDKFGNQFVYQISNR